MITVTRDMHNTLHVGSLFRTTPSPETHDTLYRVIEDTIRTFPYSPFVLGHHLVHNVHVYNHLCSAQSRHRNTALFPPLSARMPLKSPVSPLQIPQSCCWSHEGPSWSASPRPASASFERLTRSPFASHTHTHTHTHTHILSLSLSPHSRRPSG